MTSIGTYWKIFRRNWRRQLWILVFTIGIPCLSQAVQPPLGATLEEGGTTFRLWAPFVDSVAVKVNDSEPVLMAKEGGHPKADDTIWVVNVPGAKVGDRYKYLIKSNGVTREFIDPRARQLTSPERGASSIIVDASLVPSQATEPAFSQMVIYELQYRYLQCPAWAGHRYI